MMKKFEPKAFEATTVNRRNRTRYGSGRDYPTKRRTTGPAEALQIRATPGLGATHTTIKAIASDPNWRSAEVNYFVVNDDHATEVAKIASGFGLRTRVITGRTSRSTSPGFCAQYHFTKDAVKAGLSVYQTCCQTEQDGVEHLCLHFENCPYHRQWSDDKPALRIMNMIYAFLPRPNWDGAGLPDPELAVVDGSALDKSIVQHAFPVDLLDGPFRTAVRQHLSDGLDLKVALVAAGVDVQLALQLEAECQEGEHRNIIPTTDTKTARAALKDAHDRRLLQLAAFYQAIAHELQFDRPMLGVEVVPDEMVKIDGKWVKQDRVHVFEQRECHIDRDVPLLILDATADSAINERIFNR